MDRRTTLIIPRVTALVKISSILSIKKCGLKWIEIYETKKHFYHPFVTSNQIEVFIQKKKKVE